MIGCSIGSQPIVGFNYGAKRYDRVLRTYYAVLRYVLIAGAAETLCFWLFPEAILHLFGSGTGNYEAFAIRYMHTFMLLVIISGIPPISMNIMSGIGKAKRGIMISMSKQLTLIVLLLILPRLMGIEGVLWSGPAADVTAAVCSLLVLRPEFRRMRAG